MCWSSNLDFTVERTTKTRIGSAVSGEGLVNVYRGTGRVLMCPVAPTDSLLASTNTMQPKQLQRTVILSENRIIRPETGSGILLRKCFRGVLLFLGVPYSRVFLMIPPKKEKYTGINQENRSVFSGKGLVYLIYQTTEMPGDRTDFNGPRISES